MERVKKMSTIDVTYDSELRNWLRQVIQESEKYRGFKKKDEYSSLPYDS